MLSRYLFWSLSARMVPVLAWWQAHRWALLGGVGFVLIMVMIRIFSHHRPMPTGYGSAHWATRKDLRAAGLLQGPGVILGKVGRALLRASGLRHVLVVGPPDGGKTSSIVFPTELSWQESLLALDLKGTHIARTRAYRQSLGPVYVFNPAAAESEHLNPLDFIRYHSDFEVQDAQRMAMH